MNTITTSTSFATISVKLNNEVIFVTPRYKATLNMNLHPIENGDKKYALHGGIFTLEEAVIAVICKGGKDIKVKKGSRLHKTCEWLDFTVVNVDGDNITLRSVKKMYKAKGMINIKANSRLQAIVRYNSMDSCKRVNPKDIHLV